MLKYFYKLAQYCKATDFEESSTGWTNNLGQKREKTHSKHTLTTVVKYWHLAVTELLFHSIATVIYISSWTPEAITNNNQSLHTK